MPLSSFRSRRSRNPPIPWSIWFRDAANPCSTLPERYAKRVQAFRQASGWLSGCCTDRYEHVIARYDLRRYIAHVDRPDGASGAVYVGRFARTSKAVIAYSVICVRKSRVQPGTFNCVGRWSVSAKKGTDSALAPRRLRRQEGSPWASGLSIVSARRRSDFKPVTIRKIPRLAPTTSASRGAGQTAPQQSFVGQLPVEDNKRKPWDTL